MSTQRTPEDARFRPQPGDKQYTPDGDVWTVVDADARMVYYRRSDGDGEGVGMTLEHWSCRVMDCYRWEPAAPDTAPPAADPLRAAYDAAVEAARTLARVAEEYGPAATSSALPTTVRVDLGRGDVLLLDDDEWPAWELTPERVEGSLGWTGFPWGSWPAGPEGFRAVVAASRDAVATASAESARDTALENARQALVTLYGEDGAARALAAAAPPPPRTAEDARTNPQPGDTCARSYPKDAPVYLVVHHRVMSVSDGGRTVRVQCTDKGGRTYEIDMGPGMWSSTEDGYDGTPWVHAPGGPDTAGVAK